ncbi:hypothetical protein [Streptomyces sp. ST2-7A]|uniref:hypothetical protein n=1 Tax=Streptomyces sp. ST2-7A TaxID=2907214 RepID=UPI001F235B08|nr:hypothetical protein [Streptomyces sp. ST2-7A]MCE7081597.1 hypothetical protein [Streptomyces sp. ST2-7A]
MEMSVMGRESAAFTAEFRSLVEALDPAAGWFAAFGRRVPGDMDLWSAGRELPPWDVVADLLQDLAARYGAAEAERRGRRIRSRYELARRARDSRPDAREDLTRRLGREDQAEIDAHRHGRELAAAERAARLAGRPEEAERLTALRMWAADDEERARGRRAELRRRLNALPAPTEPAVPPQPGPPPAEGTGPADVSPATIVPTGKPARRPRGARFAGIEEDPAPTAPATAPAASRDATESRRPAGSRFAGAEGGAASPTTPTRRVVFTEEDRRIAGEIAGRLARLRARGLSADLYMTLCGAVAGPPQHLPLLVESMEREGLGPEIATLLWEAATLPPGPVVAIAEALADRGRESECRQLLRQAAARPVADTGAIAGALLAAGRSEEAVTLLASLVRARRAEEAVGAALDNPDLLAPVLLDAALSVSPRHHNAVAGELRRAGAA